MNPVALFLFVIAVGLGVGALLVGVPYNSLWLFAVVAVVASITVQVFLPPLPGARK